MSFIFTSGLGNEAPMGRGSAGAGVRKANARAGNAKNIVFFILGYFKVYTNFRNFYKEWIPPARFLFLSSTWCFRELMLTFSSKPINNTRELK
jgi:hypothetical protein